MADPSVTPTQKTCRECGETKPVAAFPHNRRLCRLCRAAYMQGWKHGIRTGPLHPIINGTHKVCSKCGELKPLEDFRLLRGPERKEGARRADCNPCAALSEQSYNATHKEQRAKTHQAYYDSHRDAILAHASEYYYAHQVERALYKQQWYAIHKDDACDYSRQHRKEHPEIRKIWRILNRARELAQRRANYAKNITAERARQRLDYQKNALQHREYAKKHAALKKNAPIADFTAEQWVMIQEIQHHRCYYCDKQCKGHLTQDHIIPLSKGGAHTLSNIVGACKNCNSSKGNRRPPMPVQPLLL